MLKMMTITGARRMKIVSVGLVCFELTLGTLLKVKIIEQIFNRIKAIFCNKMNFFQILKTTYSIIMVFNSM